MKYNIIFVLAICLSTIVQAQIPAAFSYQAIAMDSDGDLVTNGLIGLEIVIHEVDPSGPTVYTETHQVMSTDLGHINLEVGRGNSSGSMGDVTFEADDHFLEIKMDINGGTDYQVVGTVQLLSVPYALHAIVSMSGEKGPEGLKGETGAQGPPGSAGTNGLNGLDGTVGGVGADGPIGPRGPAGEDGDEGLKGEDGTAEGSQGPQGLIGPQGDPGPSGGLPGLPGPTGLQGPVGPQGPIGPEGDQGDPGLGGGIMGDKGPDGPPGSDKGEKGADGLPGINGMSGQDGPPGATGLRGQDGITNQPMLSSPPNSTANMYLDDGSNREDGQPGFRYQTSDGTWTDL